VCTHPGNFSVKAGHVGAAGVASAEVSLAVVAAHRPKLVRQALTAFTRRQKVAWDAVEAGKVIHGTANGHEHTHADRVDDGGEGDPGSHPARVWLDAQDEYTADDDSKAHHQDSAHAYAKRIPLTSINKQICRWKPAEKSWSPISDNTFFFFKWYINWNEWFEVN